MYGTPIDASGSMPVTVVDPTASLIAALLTTSDLELEDLDELELSLELGLDSWDREPDDSDLEELEDEDFFASFALSSCCFFIASSLARLAFSASELDDEGFESEEEDLGSGLDELDSLEEVDAGILGASGIGLALSSCDTSWIEKKSRSKKPSVRLTRSGKRMTFGITHLGRCR